MGFELITYGYRTPRRLFALAKLVSLLHSPTTENLKEWLQPRSIRGKTDIASDVIKTAHFCKLIEKDSQGNVSLVVNKSVLENIANFRKYLQNILLKKTDPNDDFFLLNQIGSWIAVQDERIFDYSKNDIAVKFESELYGTDNEGRVLNVTKLSAWITWAEFLGWGWSSNDVVFVPDATDRILPVLNESKSNKEMLSFSDFMETMSVECPELDNGYLYKLCWNNSRGGEQQSNQLSLMLSNGLRVLDHQGAIKLVEQGDAVNVWQLYKAMGHSVTSVTHIERQLNNGK